MEETRPVGRSWILWTAVSFLAVCALAVSIGVWWQWHGQRAQRDGREGLTAMYQGDYKNAQRFFAQAMNEARSAQDRAGYEMLLAASLEGSTPNEAARHYLSVIDTEVLSPQVRGTAGVYLLMLLNARHDAAFTKAVFAQSPWRDLYQELKPDESINAEIAITKAHEAILDSYPNFFSFLIAGDFYARKYPYLTGSIARFREEYSAKAVDYFDKGTADLGRARDTNEWDRSRLALGYTYAMAYVVALSEAGLGSMTEEFLRATYLEAAGFADDNSRGEVLMESARFTIRLAYARYLAANPTPLNSQSAATIADELAALAQKAANQPHLARIMSSPDPTSKYGRLKNPLLFMASSSPALAKVLADVVIQSQ